MNSRISLFSILVKILFTAIISASHGSNETDYQALLQFKSMITNDVLSSWNSSFHFCDWNGVSCGRRHRRVTALVLHSQGLEGSLSPHIGNLSFLRYLYLKNNSFQGTIPDELGRLSRLSFLHLGYNSISGVIPANLSRCSNLKDLRLGNNMLVGSIPKEISFLSKLTTLVVQYNKLTGGLSPFLGNITSMEGFSVNDNPLGGSIPDTLGNWKSLTEFDGGGCNLYGTIPHSIYNLSLLTYFSLPENQLIGTLPLAATLPHLVYLQLWGNQLNGPLPVWISNCSKLEHFEVTANNFSGKLTIDFSKLKDIYQIGLGVNTFGFGETDDMKFIDTLKNCSRLEVLLLDDCKFQGALPTSIGNLSHQLTFLHLGRNHLYGNLPSSIGNLVGLTKLVLGENQFTGKIPSTIGELQNLQEAYLYDNQFSGPIPDAIGNLSSLTKLWLNSNKLERNIPSILGNCHNLLMLYLDQNKLSGTIPKQLLQIPALTISLNLSQNNLFGSLPIEVGELKLLTSLDLSDNNLSGNIPSSLGGCTSLVFLNLRGNLFRGTVPSSLSSMRGISTLDLSHNNLSGQIPQFSKRFSFEYVDLSFNDFHGEVPVLGLFANASAFSILGNNRLCGGLPELGLPKCKVMRKHRKGFPLFVIVILIASTIFAILCFAYAWCKKRKSQPSQSSTDERFMKVAYGQLLKATNGFSEANLIGQGGFSTVYKGILDHDDRFVAVKVLHLQNRGAHKSFIAECEAWPRFLGTNSNQNSTSGIRGTIGYAPPEYGLGNGLARHVTDVIDDDLLDFLQKEAIATQCTETKANKIEECLASTVKIGVSCSVDSPAQRMNIEKVVHELQHILDMLQNI
ncbi:hypothetical protein L1887_09068 [Cichorium endivia]|nr:hypothetical protein L1887_09068 [Cichorium endivia]